MLMRTLSLVAILATLALSTPARAEFTAEQTAEIQGIVKDYLVNNPDVMKAALESLQNKLQAEAEAQRAEEERKAAEQLADKAMQERLQQHGMAAVDGNPEGDVTVIEFFDYNCGYCRSSYPTIQQLKHGDAKVRVIYREFPVLGQNSVTAAKAALASSLQGKYLAMHDALMKSPGQLNEKTVFDIAAEVGLDVARLKKDMESEAVSKEISENYNLAETLGIRGTPAFIVGAKLFPGAVPLEELKSAVAGSR